MSDLLSTGQIAVEFARLLVAAFLSGFVAVRVVNRLKSRTDHVEKRIDDICTDIRGVADMAGEYWAKPPSNELGPIEARVQARIRLIEELRVSTAREAVELASDAIVATAQAFIRDVTGGNFGVHNRVADFGRAASVQNSAVKYIVAIRRARLTALGAK